MGNKDALYFRSYAPISNGKRMKIMVLLLDRSPASAGELAGLAGLNEPAFKQHVFYLENAGLVKSDVSGRGRYEICEDGRKLLQILGITKNPNRRNSDCTKAVKDAFSNIGILRQMALGDKEKWVTVLGAFDTWPYMDYACTVLARLGLTAFTSRYNYRMIDSTIMCEDAAPDPGMRMGDFLYSMIAKSPRSVVVYSVSAGHYVETDWCYKQDKQTLGLVFVRDTVPPGEHCRDLLPDFRGNFAVCNCKGEPSWNCIAKKQCPFKKQGISYNIIEYFLEPNRMSLAAVSRMADVDNVVRSWLNGELAKNFRHPYIRSKR